MTAWPVAERAWYASSKRRWRRRAMLMKLAVADRHVAN